MQYILGDIRNLHNILFEESEEEKPVERIWCACIVTL
jgi:hypothetical protein